MRRSAELKAGLGQEAGAKCHSNSFNSQEILEVHVSGHKQGVDEIQKKTMQHDDVARKKEAVQLLLLGSLEPLLEASS